MSISQPREYTFADGVHVGGVGKLVVGYKRDSIDREEDEYFLYQDVLTCVTQKQIYLLPGTKFVAHTIATEEDKTAEARKWIDTIPLDTAKGEHPVCLRVLENNWKRFTDDQKDKFALYIWDLKEKKQAMKRLLSEGITTYDNLIDDIRATL